MPTAAFLSCCQAHASIVWRQRGCYSVLIPPSKLTLEPESDAATRGGTVRIAGALHPLSPGVFVGLKQKLLLAVVEVAVVFLQPHKMVPPTLQNFVFMVTFVRPASGKHCH